MLDNFNSDLAGFSERNSIIDNGHNGDTNNNFHIDSTLDENDEGIEDIHRKLIFSRLRRYFKRKIISSKFKNAQIEMLYQRYLLRMNQNNAAHIVWLLFALILILAIIHLYFLLRRWNNEFECEIPEVSSNNQTSMIRDVISNYTMLENELNSTAELLNESMPLTTSNKSISCINSYQLLATNLVQFSLLGLCSILYTILLLCLYKQRINEIYLFHVSYAIIISLVIIDVSFSIAKMGK